MGNIQDHLARQTAADRPARAVEIEKPSSSHAGAATIPPSNSSASQGHGEKSMNLGYSSL
jgi:hypothetical protein